mmetsp:Transcript_45190/g.106039  ORF Transcript_45190/g.106039 Transcript_45190/m.106039 type:complete len:228 (-) Transcript_45190:587-1270(-)
MLDPLSTYPVMDFIRPVMLQWTPSRPRPRLGGSLCRSSCVRARPTQIRRVTWSAVTRSSTPSLFDAMRPSTFSLPRKEKSRRRRMGGTPRTNGSTTTPLAADGSSRRAREDRRAFRCGSALVARSRSRTWRRQGRAEWTPLEPSASGLQRRLWRTTCLSTRRTSKAKMSLNSALASDWRVWHWRRVPRQTASSSPTATRRAWPRWQSPSSITAPTAPSSLTRSSVGS